MLHLRHCRPAAVPPPVARRLALAVALAGCWLAAPRIPAQIGEAEQFRTDLEVLTSPVMEGRGVGTAGGEQAIRYLVERMEQIGLQPGIAGGYRQEFEVEEPSPASYLPQTRVALRGPAGESELVLGSEAVPFRFSSDGTVDAEVVFAGYGLVIPELNWDDYRELDVRGKVVLVLRGAPAWRDASSPFRQHRRELFFATKAARAAERGAVAMLLCERQDESAAGREPDLRMALRASGSAELPALWLSRQAAGRLFRGGLDTLRRRQRRLDTAAERHIRACGRGPTGTTVRLTVKMAGRHPRLPTSNVIGILPGSDPERAGEFVVIGAHHDHLGRGGYASLAAPEDVGKVHPGADDNASGLAGMLLLATRLKQGPALPRSIAFVAFGAEEYGQHGSRHFLASGPIAAGAVLAMVDFDMIGRARSGRLQVQGAQSGKGLEDLVRQKARGLEMAVEVHAGAAPRSDHYSFLARRIPALLFHTGLHDQYHRPTDVAALVEVDGCLQVVDLAEAVVRELAGMAARPEFRRPKRD